ncbi:hypothetical protein ACIOEW_23855 [Streptomyces sp. NPDC087901]|uniref:hypothetical protein n=1 Tax=unclassified Streptomyces TaxID=2593676 RepID=UPI00341B1535
MADVEELLEGVAVRLPAAEEIRTQGRRRRTRSRAVRAVAGAAVLVTAGVCAVVLPESPERGHGTVAVAPQNPFLTDGVVRMREADELPGYAQWHWKANEGLPDDAAPQGGPLPQVGLDQACPGSFARTDEPGQKRYSLQYRGRDDALAQHRLVTYDDAATAREQLTLLRGAMTACGLTSAPPTADEEGTGSSAWSGTVKDGRTMRVTVRRWNSWVSVVEVLDGRAAR